MKICLMIVFVLAVLTGVIALEINRPPEGEWMINAERNHEERLCILAARVEWRNQEHEYKWSEEGKESFRQEMRECSK